MRRRLEQISLLLAVGAVGLVLAVLLSACGSSYGGGGGGKTPSGTTSTGNGY
jgi:hypothetical protein